MSTTQAELRLSSLLDEREQATKLHETVIATVEASDNKVPSESQAEQIKMYREKQIALDNEIEQLAEDVDRNRKSIEASKAIRRVLAGNADGVDVDGDGVVYRTMAAYARDVILTSPGRVASQVQALLADKGEMNRAAERLQLIKRTPATTLTSDLAGLNPPQHIAQIFQVIDDSRPLVATALRDTLERGTLTYPQVDATPVVAVQATQKTEAGNTGMDISMVTTTASTYLGGGNLSWQAVNWSTPNALDLWFRFAAADYALKTEQDAAQALQHSGFSNNISSTIPGSADYAALTAAIAAGGGDVFSNSGRMADTVYMAPDRYWYALGLTSASSLPFGQTALLNINGEERRLNVVVSRGMDAGVIVVGDSEGLLVAETAGAPVELRVVEPAIGGYEVGLIGAFEAVVVDDGAFAMITTAS